MQSLRGSALKLFQPDRLSPECLQNSLDGPLDLYHGKKMITLPKNPLIS
jgi:hypothetical protein